jgi:TnpA family transposase
MALRELGRIERTLFTLEWLQSTELRRRVQSGLNKGEAKNALARAVFFNRLGEMRDRSFENQRYRASGLTLVVAAVILWNTVYLSRAALRKVFLRDRAVVLVEVKYTARGRMFRRGKPIANRSPRATN